MKVDISVNDNVIVFGSGTIAANCIKYLREKIKGDIFVFEQKQNAVSVLQRQISSLSKVYYQIVDENIVATVNKIKSKVIFSINNIYIFNKELIDNKLIINYHNSLLPKHPGRFAEAWSIFEEDKKLLKIYKKIKKKHNYYHKLSYINSSFTNNHLYFFILEFFRNKLLI